MGKPEPLKGDWRGWWSRRITQEHRLIYRIHAGAIEIARCRFHYKNDSHRRGDKVDTGRTGSLFFWRDRTREVDFVADVGGRLELFEAKWTELPADADAANLAFVRDVVGKKRIAGGAVVCRAPNSFPSPGGFRALSVVDIV